MPRVRFNAVLNYGDKYKTKKVDNTRLPYISDRVTF